MQIVPVLTQIEARWKPELVQRPDVVEVSGQLRDVSRSELLQQSLRIRFDWYDGVNSLFFQTFTWGAELQPAAGPLLERQPAAELIGRDSIFANVARDLYSLAEKELNPIAIRVPYAIPTFLAAEPVSRLNVFLPIDRPRERLVEIETIHYVDKECTQNAFKKVKQWVGRQVIQDRNLKDETPAEELLNNPLIEPHVIDAIRTSGELVQSIYPTFAIDLEAWLSLAQATIDSFA